MKNPWLDIPAADYEGHMSSPNVKQLSFLGSVFKDALEYHDCNTVALLGCATGNGLQHVNKELTCRVTAVDINPEYLGILRQRYGDTVPGLEVIQADLESCELEKNAYSLIFAGLFFEYVDPRVLLLRIAEWLKFEGIFMTVLQLPSAIATITQTPYTSIKSLHSIMKLIDPNQFKIMAIDAGLTAIEEKFITLETGKSFYIGTYKKIA